MYTPRTHLGTHTHTYVDGKRGRAQLARIFMTCKNDLCVYCSMSKIEHCLAFLAKCGQRLWPPAR